MPNWIKKQASIQKSGAKAVINGKAVRYASGARKKATARQYIAVINRNIATGVWIPFAHNRRWYGRHINAQTAAVSIFVLC
jgi:hypothetical protein